MGCDGCTEEPEAARYRGARTPSKARTVVATASGPGAAGDTMPAAGTLRSAIARPASRAALSVAVLATRQTPGRHILCRPGPGPPLRASCPLPRPAVPQSGTQRSRYTSCLSHTTGSEAWALRISSSGYSWSVSSPAKYFWYETRSKCP